MKLKMVGHAPRRRREAGHSSQGCLAICRLHRRKFDTLRESLAADETRTEALGILRSLIEAVVIDRIECSYEIELISEIASMIDLAAGCGQQKSRPGRAALDTEDRRLANLVAGARFELTTFRL